MNKGSGPRLVQHVVRFKTKSHVIAVHPLHPDQKYLARIDHFSKVDVKADKNSNYSVWVHFYYEHNAKYGSEVPHKSGQDQPLQIFITSDLSLLKVKWRT